MAQKLTDSIVKALPAPASGNRIEYDSDVKGFGCRVTASGARSFILNYRTRSGRERRFTIGQFPEWKVAAARKEAGEWKRRVGNGEDPLASIEAERTAPTMADLCQRFDEEHVSKKRPSTAADYRSLVKNDILPALKHHKVAEVTFSDVDALHRRITKRAPYRANRAMAVMSKMFTLAMRWDWRTDNPTRGIEWNHEEKRERYLAGDELGRLTSALTTHPDRQAANIIRLLLLTGARRGEVLSAKWEQFDLTAGIWTKPSAHTKQKKVHRTPLLAPARQLLSEIYADAEDDAEFVFPGRSEEGRRTQIKKDWKAICKAAGLKDVRIHDLRHSYASILVSSGLSLPIIGALLGHTQPQTTARYAHLFDDPLRAATERVGAIVTGRPAAEVVPLKGGGV
jgi:integrase